MSAADKVLEIHRRKHNGLTPGEMAADLKTEGWQRKQEEKKKRSWQVRGDTGKKIKEVEKGKKSVIGEDAKNSQSLTTPENKEKRKLAVSGAGPEFPAEKQPDRDFHTKKTVRESIDLEELAKATLRSYVSKARENSASSYAKADRPISKIKKRVKGIGNALDKLHPKN